MKRLVLVLALCLLIGVVSATSLNFQNPDDYTRIQAFHKNGGAVGYIEYAQSLTGGNNYVTANAQGNGGGSGLYTVVVLKNPSQTTYAAATISNSGGSVDSPCVILFNSAGGILYNYHGTYNLLGRFEVKMSGGKAYIYRNGVLAATSGTLAANPSYVGFGVDPLTVSAGTWITKYIDDYVYGETEQKYILGFPQSNADQFYILKDMTNPAASGFYNGTTGIQVNANYTSGQWSGGDAAVPPNALNNESIQLVNFFDGTIYDTTYTNAIYNGTVTFDVTKYIINNVSAPMGYYALHIPGTTVYSNPILYRSTGATVTWSSKNYNTGDTGTVIYYVMSGGYWDTTNYDYKVAVLDMYGNFQGNTSISTSSGSVTHAWSDTDNPGVYYAWLIATSRSSGTEYILGSDYTTLSGYVALTGYVNGAVAGVLTGANVSIVQGSTAYNLVTASDGAYSTIGTSFITGAPITFNITATGYFPYNATLTPLSAKTINPMNFTLNLTSPSYTGLGIGGIARDGTFDGTTITGGYGRPLVGVTVIVSNSTTAESYTKTTNAYGWYLCDNGASCSLASQRPYNIFGSKIGYASANYTAVMP